MLERGWDLTPWLGYGALMYFTTLPLDVSPKEPIFEAISKVLCNKSLFQKLFATSFILLVGFGDGERPVAILTAGVHWL